MKTLKIAIIGAGWIGTSHAIALHNVRQHYGTAVVPVLDRIIDADGARAEAVCEQYGFRTWGTDPAEAIDDPEIDVVMITTPNQFHVDLVERAAAAKKAIFCEKPLGMDAKEAKRAVDAVEAADVPTMVGFVYVQNPAVVEARRIIESGELGPVVAFHGQYDMEYSADPNMPHRWRDYDAISGALGDIGAHMLVLCEYVTGARFDEVCGRSKIVYDKRPDPKNPDKTLPVTNDDVFKLIFSMDNGILGSMTTTRVAPGEKVAIRFEVQCTRGTIRFDQERMNELEVYYQSDGKYAGFRNVKMGPQHGEYGVFCAQQGIGVSWIDLMTMQIHKLLAAVAEGGKTTPDIRAGYEANVLLDAILKSDKEKRWVKVDECRPD